MYYLFYPKRAYLIASEKGAKVNVVFFNFIMILLERGKLNLSL